MASGLFDPDFYLQKYPDVAEGGLDPLEHFLKNGGRESRSPSGSFDGPLYVLHNPEAKYADNILLDWLDNRKKGVRIPPRPLPGWSKDEDLEIAAAIKPKGQPVSKVGRLALARARSSGLFDLKHTLSANPDILAWGDDPLKTYLQRTWRENRSIGAEFDGHYVLTALMGQDPEDPASKDPLTYYLAKGRKKGWNPRPEGSITLTPQHALQTAAGPAPRIAIQIHLFYVDMVQLFAAYLRQIPFAFDLLISTTTQADARFIENYLAQNLPLQGKVVVRVVPNRGRDIAPLLVGFANLLKNYDYVCHLHSKRSPHAGFGEQWLQWVLNSMFGEAWIPQAAIGHLQTNPDCAVMFPDNYYKIKRAADWNGNEERTLDLLNRWGLGIEKLPAFPNFAAGSMAWFRGSFLESLAAKLSLKDFEEETGQIEGTLAHILERAIPVAAEASGQSVCRYYLEAIPETPSIKIAYGPSPQSEAMGEQWVQGTPSIAKHKPLELAPLAQIFNKKRLQISWIIPDFILGAGGHLTIFRTVQFLEKFGHHQTIWIQGARNHPHPLAAKNTISRHYRQLGDRVNVRFLPDDIRQLSGDVIIATDFWTAFPAAQATNFKERFYFIQDYEPYFHAMGDSYLLAESTYDMGFSALCAGKWLLSKAQQHGMWARSWDLAVDREHYYPPKRPKPPASGKKPRKIVFYGRSYTPRRAVALGIAAFEELARRRNDFVVQIFGEEPGKTFNFPNKQLGILSPAQLGKLYREADLGVCFSTTNYSLVPLEIMACGAPVVEVDAESARTAFPEGSVAFATPNPQGVADAIEKLLDDEAACAAQVKRAFDFVDGLDWEHSARAVESALLERLEEKGYQAVDLDKLAPPAIAKTRKASVIIPTYNGGDLFREVLHKTASQVCDFDYDILVIDSSSTDGTGELAAKFGGRVRCEVIDQRDFQHGRTRNRAIELTDGEVVAVLTQDAMPFDENWLRELVAPFSADPKVAGAIGRHRAYPQHNRLVARDLDAMFDRFRDMGPLFSLDQGLPGFIRPGSMDWQMALHFYSDNNSAMRRTVWNLLPYPEVEWGEDQVWCWEMLKLGLTKAYADKSVVWHSHNLTKPEQIKVGMHEGELFARFFGYSLGTAPFTREEMNAVRQAAIAYAEQAGIPVAEAEAYARMVSWSHEGRVRGARMPRT